MHSVDLAGADGDGGISDDADSWMAEEATAPVQERGVECGEPVVFLPGDDGRTLDGDALGENQFVAWARPIGPHQVACRDVAQHESHNHRPVEPVRNLRMPPDQGDVETVTGGGNLVEDVVDEFAARALLRQEEGGQEPPGYSAGAGNVVGVDVNGIPPDLVAGKRNRVGLGDEESGLILAAVAE